MSMESNIKARDHLLHLVKVTGAQVENLNNPFNQPRVHLIVEGKEFIIGYGRVERAGKFGMATTCDTVQGGMPPFEEIASALLLLKHDPTIFDRWAKQDGFYS